MKNKLARISAASGAAILLLLAVPAFAQTVNATTDVGPIPQHTGMHWGGMGKMPPGIFGTVSAINGTTLTVTQKGRPVAAGATAPAPTTYTVDATNATVTKAGAASTLSSIAVGDMVMVTGTVSGTSVTATAIHDGIMQRMGGQKPPANPIITGNGQPVVGGNVTAVSGTTLTVTNKSNVTYTVDTSSATIQKGNAKAAVTDIAVGDSVVIQGTVNGTSIVASSVLDSGAPKTVTNPTTGAVTTRPGFMGAIGGFFHSLFGFF